MKSVWRAAVRWRRYASTSWRSISWTPVGVILVLALLVPASALTQPVEPQRGTLSVAEPRVQLSLNPGAAAEGELRFTYDGPTPTSGRVSVVEYRLTPDGPQYTPASAQSQDNVVRWVTVSPGTLELRPGVPEAVRYRVESPNSARPGDHSAMVMVESDQPGARVGVRLTVNVPGAAQAKPELVAFRAQRVPLTLLNHQIPTELPLYDSGPVVFRAQIRNAGNLQLSPRGKVYLTDPLGNTVASLDLPADQVFPGDTATFVTPWVSPPTLGVFSARLSLQAGDASLAAEEQLVLLPWQQLLAAALFVLALRLLLGSGFSLPLPLRRQTDSARTVRSNDGALRTRIWRHSDQPAPPTQPALTQPALPPAPAIEAERVAAELATTSLDQPARTAEPVASVAPAVEPAPAPALAPEPMLEPASQLNGKAEQPDALDLLHWGQQAARNGERLVAYRTFVYLVEIDPRNEDAWLWRAATAADQQECRRCLETVLQLNPSNQRAQRGLESLQEQEQFARKGA